MPNLARLLLCCAVLLSAPGALAQIQLQMAPTYIEAEVGDSVTFDVVLDTLGAAVLGGGWDVVYDPSRLELLDYAIVAEVDPQLIGRPRKTPGRLINMAIGSFAGYPTAPATIATVTFRVLASGPATASPEESTGINSIWPDANDFGSFYTPVGQSGRVVPPGTPYPLMRVDPTVLESGIAPGTTVDIPVSVYNDGTGGLAIDSIALATQGPGTMTIANDPCSGAVVPAGGQCDVTLRFDSTHDAAYSSVSHRVTFDTSDDITLNRATRITTRLRRAIVGLPEVEILSAPVGGPAVEKRITLVNTGDWPTTLGELTIDNPQGAGVSFNVRDDGCSFQFLDIGASCDVRVSFFANQVGRLITRYRLPYADGAFGGSANLRGYSVTGVPIVDYDGPRTVSVSPGTSLTRQITVTNKGQRPLVLDAAPQSEGPFVVVANTCLPGVAIAPEASCAVDVQITPNTTDPDSWLWFSTTDSVYRGFINPSLILTAPARTKRRDQHRLTRSR